MSIYMGPFIRINNPIVSRNIRIFGCETHQTSLSTGKKYCRYGCKHTFYDKVYQTLLYHLDVQHITNGTLCSIEYLDVIIPNVECGNDYFIYMEYNIELINQTITPDTIADSINKFKDDYSNVIKTLLKIVGEDLSIHYGFLTFYEKD